MTPQAKRQLVRVGAGVLFFAVLIWLMQALEVVTTIIMVAFVLAYILAPAVRRLNSWGIGRTVASLLIVFLSLLLLVAAILFIVPAVFREIASFVSAFPAYIGMLQELALRITQALNITLPQDWNEVATLVMERGRQALPKLADVAGKVASSVFKSTLHVIAVFFYVMLVPVITYYLLVSFEDVKQSVYELIPPYLREPVVEKLIQIDMVLSGFIRGQLTICLILACLYSLGFIIIGIDLAIFLGIVSGFLFIIPYFGTIIGLVGGSLMALVKYGDLTHVFYVLAWIGCVQLLEGYVLTPRIVGKAIGLHPVVYILVLLAAGNLFGFVGLLVAIPATAVLKVLLMTLIDAYRKSYLYQEPVDATAHD
jgi:predicted PurR-regulated permease PerM